MSFVVCSEVGTHCKLLFFNNKGTRLVLNRKVSEVKFDSFVILLLWSPLAWGNAIDYSKLPPADWPKLALKAELHSPEEVTKICADFGSPGSEACALVNYTRRTCIMYLPYSPSDRVVKHELAHCLGYDHYEDNILQNGWKRYKESQ